MSLVAPALGSLDAPVPPSRFLSNGSYRVLITSAGTGFSATGGHALTRFRGDRIEDRDGFFIYVRDLESGAFWSAGSEPTASTGDRYEAAFEPGIFAITRVDHEIETRLDICVPPRATVELRRLTLSNRSDCPRRIELTSLAEVVLHDPTAHAAHPVFSKLFLQTELVPDPEVLLACRRPRAAGEDHPWLFHALQGASRAAEVETDRRCFVGRGRNLASPLALLRKAPLSGSTGSVLDPIVSLRTVLDLAPGESRQVTFLLGAARDRSEAVAGYSRWSIDGAIDEGFASAGARARDLLEELSFTGGEAEYFQALAGAIHYGHPALRAGPEVLARAAGDPGDLGRLGLRTQYLAVLHAERPDGARLVPDVLGAHRMWEAMGLPIDLIVLAAGDLPAMPGSAPLDRTPRLHLLRIEDLTPSDRDLIDAAARLVLTDSLPDLEALSVPGTVDGDARSPGIVRPRPSVREDTEGKKESGAPLRFWNGLGGFSADGSEYVIRLAGDHDLELPPRPWINVIANEQFGFLVSETGAGYTWSGNSREHRLTPWSNDPLLDPHGEAFYIRDEETGTFWSPLPGPAHRMPSTGGAGESGGDRFEVSHGFGYSTCRQALGELDHQTTLFVPRRDPLRITMIRIRNRGRQRRRLKLFAYYRLVLGTTPEESGRFVITEADAESGAVFARNRLAAEFGDRVAFAAVVAPEGRRSSHFTADRESFIGRRGSSARPAALLERRPLDGRAGAGLDPCIACEVELDLPPGESRTVSFLLGEAGAVREARTLVLRYSAPGAVEAALAEVRAEWERDLAAIKIETPSPALDLMVNGWLPHQALSCRLRGRSALYQSGGAFGFRDQLQDAASLIYLRPDLTRAQILLHAAHQFPEGDVLHWWHPPLSRGIRTRCSDDLLWLPYVAAAYIQTTGDRSILDEEVGFVSARELAPGEDEAYLIPGHASESADLYTHCCLAIDRGLTSGEHGLPLIGTGDWNDGMNRVGREGRGESVWLGFFLCAVLGDFVPICEERRDGDRAGRYRIARERLVRVLNDAAWDGEWYRRGYYDDGTPLGSHANAECRIDALAQAWAVISGVAPPARAAQAIDSVERHLVSEEDGLVRLLAPPFENDPRDPGYIKGYVPGARENGGQYTHAALWVVRAIAEMGRSERAAALLDMLNPVHRAASPERVRIYEVEPYVVAADVHGAPPHTGRGGWTWYTGSAGWMYRVALESVLGFRIADGTTLVLEPCVPREWDRYQIHYRVPGSGTRYEITGTNADGESAELLSATVDGMVVPARNGSVSIPLHRDGGLHRVELVLGERARSSSESK